MLNSFRTAQSLSGLPLVLSLLISLGLMRDMAATETEDCRARAPAARCRPEAQLIAPATFGARRGAGDELSTAERRTTRPNNLARFSLGQNKRRTGPFGSLGRQDIYEGTHGSLGTKDEVDEH